MNAADYGILRALNTSLAFIYDSLGEQPRRIDDDEEKCPRCRGQSEGREADLCPGCLREIQIEAEARAAKPSINLMSDTQLATTSKPQKVAVLGGNRGLKLQSLDEMWRFATAVVASRAYKDIDTPEAAVIRIQAGLELGLTPVWSLANIMVTNGRPSVWGDALLGLVLSHRDCEDVIETFEGEGENLTAVCEVHRKGRLPIKRTFSVADAKRAGLSGRGVHVTYPKRMLQMRARSWACRDSFADALRGLGVIEELRDLPEPKSVRVIEKPILVLPDEPGDEIPTKGGAVDAESGGVQEANPIGVSTKALRSEREPLSATAPVLEEERDREGNFKF